MTTPTMGPKQFRDPLVKALGDLSGMKPDVALDHKILYAAVCKDMGITIDQFGSKDGTGSPWVERWCQWAFKDLETAKPPLTIRMGKGKWALTSDGISRAQALGGGIMAPAIQTPNPVSKMDAAYSDPYLRSLGIQETKCFDFFSDQAPTCVDCPIREGCRNAQMAAYSEVARILISEDEKSVSAIKAAAARKAADEAAKAKAAASGGATPPAGNAPPAGTTTGKITRSQKVTCQQDALCQNCGKKLVKGSDIVWVRSDNGKAGLLHLECYDLLVQAGDAKPLVDK